MTSSDVSVDCPLCNGHGRVYCRVSHGDPWDGGHPCDCDDVGPCKGCRETGKVSIAVLSNFKELMQAKRQRYEQQASEWDAYIASR